MQNDGEDGEQTIDVGLGIHISLGAVRIWKNRSTADQVVQFDSLIRNAFAKKEHVFAIFFEKSLRHHVETRYTVRSLRS